MNVLNLLKIYWISLIKSIKQKEMIDFIIILNLNIAGLQFILETKKQEMD